MNDKSQANIQTPNRQDERTLLLFAYCLAFVQGLTIQLMPVLFRGVGQTFRVGLSSQGKLQSAFFFGSLIVGFGGGGLFERLGSKRTAVASLLLLGLGAFTLCLSPALWVLLVGGVLFGIGNAWLTVIYSTIIARQSGKHRQRVFTWALLFMALGGTVGPVLLGFALNKTSTWRTPVFSMGVLFVLAILFLRQARVPALDLVEKRNEVHNLSFWGILQRKRLWLIGFLFILHALGGGVLVSWIGRLYELRCGIGVEHAALLLSVNAGGFFVGRFALGAWFGDRLPDRVLLALCATGATVVSAFLLLGNSYILAVLLMGLEGFLMSGDAPSISSLTARESVSCEGAAFAFVQAMSAIGSIISPWLVGVMGEHYGLSRAIWLGPLFLFLLAVISITWEMCDYWWPVTLKAQF